MSVEAFARRHHIFGWWSLLAFLTMGIVLEALHGLKIGLYLDVSNETRRLHWTLCHAHGTLLGLVNIVFGLSLRSLAATRPTWMVGASRSLLAAAVLLPGGFFLGGLVIHAGDPGLGILLVPVGGLLLLIGVALAARGFSRA